jgi:hypothetical protein
MFTDPLLLDTGLRFHTRARVHVQAAITWIMLAVRDQLPDPGLEYGLYLKGAWDPEECEVRVSPTDWIFPRQVTTATSIKFLEQPPDETWNVVIHRHPAGCRSFSGVDRESINKEFLASILYLPEWDYPQAVVNVPLAPGSKIQLEATVVPGNPAFEVAGLAALVARNLRRPEPPAPRADEGLLLLRTGGSLAPGGRLTGGLARNEGLFRRLRSHADAQEVRGEAELPAGEAYAHDEEGPLTEEEEAVLDELEEADEGRPTVEEVFAESVLDLLGRQIDRERGR